MCTLNHSQRPAARWLAGIGLLLLAAAVPALGQDPACHEGDAAQAAAPAPAAPQRLRALNIPDSRVFDQDGRGLRFYTDLVQGKVVIMNFIFTTCTTICPPMAANFSRLQDLLGDQLGTEVHLISVSVDPVTDTPARMKAFGEKFHRKPGWTLVTGSKPEVDKLLKALKIFTPDKNDHSPTVLMGNDALGIWTRAYGLAAPESLMETLAAVTSGSQEAPLEGRK